jgi:hypothetical protein
LLALLTGGSRSDDATRLRTLLILSQVHAVHSGRENVVRTMRWRVLDADKIALIKRLIREHTRAVLGAALKSAVASDQRSPSKGLSRRR